MPGARTLKLILSQLSRHLEQRHENLQSTFLRVDADRNGWISREEFGEVFKLFNFAVSPEELAILVEAFDINKDGKVSWLEFTHLISQGPDTPMKIKEPPILDPSPKTPPPAKTVDHVSIAVRAILSQLKKHLEQHYDDLHSSFLNLDTNRNGWISKQEFATLFHSFNFPITEEELSLLIDAFDSNKDGKVSYLEFCNTLVNGPWSPLNIKQRFITDPRLKVTPHKDPNEAKLHVLLTALQRALELRFQTVTEAFMFLDRNRSGYVSNPEIVAVLRNQNVHVTPEDLQLLIDYFDTDRDGLINWEEFSRGIQMNKWNPRGAGGSRNAPPVKLSGTLGVSSVDRAPSTVNAVHQELRRYAAARYETNKDAFLAFNTSRSGAIERDEFEQALVKASDSRPTKDLSNRMFALYDLNQDGKIQFTEFVKALSRTLLE